MESENDRDEYVLNDHGAIWRGSVSSSGPCNWNFGQFEEGILDATLHVLKMDARLQTSRGLNKLRDPVWLGRILSGMIQPLATVDSATLLQNENFCKNVILD